MIYITLHIILLLLISKQSAAIFEHKYTACDGIAVISVLILITIMYGCTQLNTAYFAIYRYFLISSYHFHCFLYHFCFRYYYNFFVYLYQQRKEIQHALKSGVSIYSRQDAQYDLILLSKSGVSIYSRRVLLVCHKNK